MMSQINEWVEKIRGCSYCGLFSSGLLIFQQGRIGEVYEVLNEFIQPDFLSEHWACKIWYSIISKGPKWLRPNGTCDKNRIE